MTVDDKKIKFDKSDLRISLAEEINLTYLVYQKYLSRKTKELAKEYNRRIKAIWSYREQVFKSMEKDYYKRRKMTIAELKADNKRVSQSPKPDLSLSLSSQKAQKP